MRDRLQCFFENDPFAKNLEMRFVDGGIGNATVAIVLTRDHTNFLGGGHGGVIFALADMAFGLASNSHDKISIGINANIVYAKGTGIGDLLVANAQEISRNRKIAVYNVDVICEEIMVATFTGTVHISSRDQET